MTMTCPNARSEDSQISKIIVIIISVCKTERVDGTVFQTSSNSDISRRGWDVIALVFHFR